jgi:hypothetical protein
MKIQHIKDIKKIVTFHKYRENGEMRVRNIKYKRPQLRRKIESGLQV